MTLRSRMKSKRDLIDENALFSRAAKLELSIVGSENDEIQRVGSEKNVLPVVLVIITYVHLLQSRSKRERNFSGP